jgi:hypothetical protein
MIKKSRVNSVMLKMRLLLTMDSDLQEATGPTMLIKPTNIKKA